MMASVERVSISVNSLVISLGQKNKLPGRDVVIQAALLQHGRRISELALYLKSMMTVPCLGLVVNSLLIVLNL